MPSPPAFGEPSGSFAPAGSTKRSIEYRRVEAQLTTSFYGHAANIAFPLSAREGRQ